MARYDFSRWEDEPKEGDPPVAATPRYDFSKWGETSQPAATPVATGQPAAPTTPKYDFSRWGEGASAPNPETQGLEGIGKKFGQVMDAAKSLPGASIVGNIAAPIIQPLKAAMAVQDFAAGDADTMLARQKGREAQTASEGSGLLAHQTLRRAAEFKERPSAKGAIRLGLAPVADVLNTASGVLPQAVDLVGPTLVRAIRDDSDKSFKDKYLDAVQKDAHGNYQAARTFNQPVQRAITEAGGKEDSWLRPAAAVPATLASIVFDPTNWVTFGAGGVSQMARVSSTARAIAAVNDMKIIEGAKGAMLFADEAGNLKKGSDLLREVAEKATTKAGKKRANEYYQAALRGEKSGALDYSIDLTDPGVTKLISTGRTAAGIDAPVKVELPKMFGREARDFVPFADKQKAFAQRMIDSGFAKKDKAIEMQIADMATDLKATKAKQMEDITAELVKISEEDGLTVLERQQAMHIAEERGLKRFDKATKKAVDQPYPEGKVGDAAKKIRGALDKIEAIDPEMSKLSPRLTEDADQRLANWRKKVTAKGGEFAGDPEAADREIWSVIRSHGSTAEFEEALNAGKIDHPAFKPPDQTSIDDYMAGGQDRSPGAVFKDETVRNYVPRKHDAEFIKEARDLTGDLMKERDNLIRKGVTGDDAKAVDELLLEFDQYVGKNIQGQRRALEAGEEPKMGLGMGGGDITASAQHQNQRTPWGAERSTHAADAYLSNNLRQRIAALENVTKNKKLAKKLTGMAAKFDNGDMGIMTLDPYEAAFLHAKDVTKAFAGKEFGKKVAANPDMSITVEQYQDIVKSNPAAAAKYTGWKSFDEHKGQFSEHFVKNAGDLLKGRLWNPEALRGMDAVNAIAFSKDAQRSLVAANSIAKKVANQAVDAGRKYMRYRIPAFLWTPASRLRDIGDGIQRIATRIGYTDLPAAVSDGASMIRKPHDPTPFLELPTGKMLSRHDVTELARERGILNQHHSIVDIWNEGSYEEIFKKAGIWDRVKSLNPMEYPVIAHSLRAGAAGDNGNRLALFMDGLRKGVGPDLAAAEVHKTFFNYNEPTQALRKLEDAIGVKPGDLHKAGNAATLFWNFTRKNYPFWLRNMLEHPGRVIGARDKLEAGAEELYGQAPPEELLAPWEKKLSLFAGPDVTDTGKPSVGEWNLGGIASMAEPTSLEGYSLQNALGKIDPVIQVAGETLTGLDSNSGKPLKSGTLPGLGYQTGFAGRRAVNLYRKLNPQFWRINRYYEQKRKAGVPAALADLFANLLLPVRKTQKPLGSASYWAQQDPLSMQRDLRESADEAQADGDIEAAMLLRAEAEAVMKGHETSAKQPVSQVTRKWMMTRTPSR